MPDGSVGIWRAIFWELAIQYVDDGDLSLATTVHPQVPLSWCEGQTLHELLALGAWLVLCTALWAILAWPRCSLI